LAGAEKIDRESPSSVTIASPEDFNERDATLAADVAE
jgi:hypothetical protein